MFVANNKIEKYHLELIYHKWTRWD